METRLITTYKEARRLLKLKGSTIRVTIQGTGQDVLAQKADILDMFKYFEREGRTGPLDYDGGDSRFMWNDDNRILFIDGGV